MRTAPSAVVSAATGIAAFLALVRGLVAATPSSQTVPAAPSPQNVGNFWPDLTRSVLYILLPLSLIFAIVLISQGVPQTFNSYATAKTLEGAEQIIPLGPAASQIAIKQLGTNGGGFFGVNSAHPFENPTPLSNFLQVLAILLLPAALTYTYGVMVGDRRQGWTIFAAMLALVVAGFAVSWWAEIQNNPATGLHTAMEGKEVRFGVMNSVLWSTTTTAASNGSVNAMHDSLSPIAGGIAVNTDFYNYALAFCMFAGRFAIIIPVLAIAGSMAVKKIAPPSPGTFPTTGATFAALLIAVVLIVGALTFFPALSLGPIAEHFLMNAGRTF